MTQMSKQQELAIALKSFGGVKEIKALAYCSEPIAYKIKQEIVIEIAKQGKSLPRSNKVPMNMILNKLGLKIDQLVEAAEIEKRLLQ